MNKPQFFSDMFHVASKAKVFFRMSNTETNRTTHNSELQGGL